MKTIKEKSDQIMIAAVFIVLGVLWILFIVSILTPKESGLHFMIVFSMSLGAIISFLARLIIGQ